jgi:hypothetical protein
MRRREFITLIGAVITWPLAARSQQSVRVHHLGFLTPTAGPTPNHKALDDALAALGYREGQNLLIERRYAEADASCTVLGTSGINNDPAHFLSVQTQ